MPIVALCPSEVFGGAVAPVALLSSPPQAARLAAARHAATAAADARGLMRVMRAPWVCSPESVEPPAPSALQRLDDRSADRCCLSPSSPVRGDAGAARRL